MNTLVHADIFFFVSTILLSLIALVFIIVLVYLIRVLREARAVAALVHQEAERVVGDLESLREKVRSESSSIGRTILTMVGSFIGKKSNSKSRNARHSK